MITRVKSFNSSLHNVSKKRLAEMQTGTFTPKRKKTIRNVSKKAASLWGKARNACLSRDGKKCVLCNATQNLHCHHFQFTRQQKPELKYDIDNLCILCYSCHNKAHNTKDSYNEYKKKIFAALHNKGIEIRNLERIPKQ